MLSIFKFFISLGIAWITLQAFCCCLRQSSLHPKKKQSRKPYPLAIFDFTHMKQHCPLHTNRWHKRFQYMECAPPFGCRSFQFEQMYILLLILSSMLRVCVFSFCHHSIVLSIPFDTYFHSITLFSVRCLLLTTTVICSVADFQSVPYSITLYTCKWIFVIVLYGRIYMHKGLDVRVCVCAYISDYPVGF